MKFKVIFLLCTILFLISFPSNQVVADAALTTTGPALTIKVGLYENRPKIFTDENGIASGFWPELINHIASREGWKVEYVKGTWAECLQRLRNNEVDIMPDVAISDERKALYAFSHEIVYTSWTQVYTRDGTKIQSIIDLEGKNVAVLKGSVNVEGADGIKSLVKAFNVNCTFIEVDSYASVFEQVKNKTADAGVTSKDFGYQNKNAFNLVETPIIFQPSRLYFAFTKDAKLTPFLIERMDVNVKELIEIHNSEYYQLLGKWFAQGSTAKSFIPIWIIWTMAGIGGLALILAAGVYVFRSRVNLKTRELREEIIKRQQAEIALVRHQEQLEDMVKQRTNELEVKTRELAESNIHLEEMSRHKSQFLANMSHELRTPLNSIIGYTKLMLDGLEGSITDEQHNDLQTVYDNSKHLLSLINDLLDLSKIESGKFEVIKEEFRVSDLLSKIIPGMEKLAKDKGLALISLVEQDIETIYADKNKTKQVLFNLLGNAVKFTQKGSVTLDIRKNGREYIFSVLDTGMGIAEQDINALFTNYKQVGPARLDGYEGTGLGLVISKQFVELQGGRIWVESELGKGSVFRFALPMK